MNTLFFFPWKKVDKGITLTAHKNICAMAVVPVKIETGDVAKSATTLLTVTRFVHNADVVLAVA